MEVAGLLKIHHLAEIAVFEYVVSLSLAEWRDSRFPRSWEVGFGLLQALLLYLYCRKQERFFGKVVKVRIL